MVEYLSSAGLTQATRQISVNSLEKCFSVCPYAPIRAAVVTREFFAFSHFSVGIRDFTPTALPHWTQNGHSLFTTLLTTGESVTHY